MGASSRRGAGETKCEEVSMDTNVIEHPLSYRQELVARLFALMRAGESCAVVGAPSAGKTRLLQHFITRDDVRKHYLGDRTATMIVSRVDGNRLPDVSEWSLYELLLTSLAEECGSHPGAFPLHTDLRALCDETMLRRDSLLALRHLELAVHRLCAEHRLSVCFILDQFDRAYLELPTQVMNNL